MTNNNNKSLHKTYDYLCGRRVDAKFLQRIQNHLVLRIIHHQQQIRRQNKRQISQQFWKGKFSASALLVQRPGTNVFFDFGVLFRFDGFGFGFALFSTVDGVFPFLPIYK